MDVLNIPWTLAEFRAKNLDDAACTDCLEHLRWPRGFTCPKCQDDNGDPFRFPQRPGVLRCRACRADVSVTAGTVLHRAHAPVKTWVLAGYWVATHGAATNVMEFQRAAGLSRYETALSMIRKLQERMGPRKPRRDGRVSVGTLRAILAGPAKSKKKKSTK